MPTFASLEKQRRYAWAQYYASMRTSHGSDLHVYLTVSRPEIDEGIPEFVQNEFREMVASLKKSVSCPICLDVLDPEAIQFSKCGHKYCEGCLARIDKCAICRKNLRKRPRV